jgi:predicted peroxiredoxin
MITQLQRMGVEMQVIDSPLDMSILENKVLRAMYIVTEATFVKKYLKI